MNVILIYLFNVYVNAENYFFNFNMTAIDITYLRNIYFINALGSILQTIIS